MLVKYYPFIPTAVDKSFPLKPVRFIKTAPNHPLNDYISWTLWAKFKRHKLTTIFFQENAFEYAICKMPSLLKNQCCPATSEARWAAAWTKPRQSTNLCLVHVSHNPLLLRGDPFRTTWWRHQMKTFSALLTICAGNSPVPGEFPIQRPVTRSFDVFFDLRLNKRLRLVIWDTIAPIMTSR